MTDADDLRRDLERRRLADELGADVDALPSFAEVAPDHLATLRRDLAAGLVARHAPVFDRFATAAGLVPARLAASITRRVIGPSLAGRMAGSLGGERTAQLLAHLDTPFLADACRTLSAEAAAELVPAIPDEQVVATAGELARRGDHATLGRFVDAIDDRRLALVLDVLEDPEDLLLAGAAADTGAALDRVVGVLSPARRAALVAAAPRRPDAARSILVRLSPASLSLLAEAVAALPTGDAVAVRRGLTDVAGEHQHLRAWAGSLD